MSAQVAVVGCGYWGKNLVRNFHRLGALGAVCDMTPAGRELAAQLAPGVRIYDDYNRLLEHPVEGVVLATPAETHYSLARLALNAGKDVFVEKPLALNAQEGFHLVSLAEAARRILMVGHVLEYHPAVVQLNRMVKDGELGKVQYVYSNRVSMGKIRREENILWSFAPHDVAVILRLLNNLPFQVSAQGGNYIQPNVADVTLTNLLFNNGVRAHIFVSWLHPFKEQRLVVVGSSKMVVFDDVAKQLVCYDQRVDLTEAGPVAVKGDGHQLDFSAQEPLELECRAYLEAIRSRVPPLTDGWSGLNVLSVLEAAQRSLIMNGIPVSMPIPSPILSVPQHAPV
ncbi:MAG: Gfo/Idh/MocA family oxidoreductase [Candidatus Eremiobacterota bacterium]